MLPPNNKPPFSFRIVKVIHREIRTFNRGVPNLSASFGVSTVINLSYYEIFAIKCFGSSCHFFCQRVYFPKRNTSIPR